MGKAARKKRNKTYRGNDAKPIAPAPPVVHNYTAKVRSPIGLWWHDNQKLIKTIVIVAVIIGFLIWVIIAGIQAISS